MAPPDLDYQERDGVKEKAEEEEMEDMNGELAEGVYQKMALGLAARAVAVHGLNMRFTEQYQGKKRDNCFKKIADSKKYEFFNLMLIVANAITLALDSPDNQNNEGLINFLNISEIVFLAFFTLEALIKILAMGLYGHSNAYLNNAWNWLDFSIVIVGLVDFILVEATNLNAANISALRLLRVLRPLRTVSKVKGMAALISTLAYSIPLLADVFLLLLLLLVMFAIIGVQLWSTTLHQRCYDKDTMELIATEGACSTLSTGRSCSTNNSICANVPSQYHINNLNYDNIGYALIVVFKVVSLDNWPNDLWLVQDTSIYSAWLYFFILVLVGSYFAVNLFLAVLSSIFTAHEELEAADKKNEEDVIKMKAVLNIIMQGTQRNRKTKVVGGGGGGINDYQDTQGDMAETSFTSESSESRSSEESQTALIAKSPNAGLDFSPYSVVLRNKSALLLRNSLAPGHYANHARSPRQLLVPGHYADGCETLESSTTRVAGDMEVGSQDSDSLECPETGPLMARHGCLLGLHQPPSSRTRNREHVFLTEDDATTVSSGSTPTIPDTPGASPRGSPRGAPYGDPADDEKSLDEGDVYTGWGEDFPDSQDDAANNEDDLEHTINIREEVANYGTDKYATDGFNEINHWDVKIDVMAFNEDKAVYQCECMEEEAGIQNCQRICVEQAFTAFAVIDGVAYFTDKDPARLRSKLKHRSGVVIFLLSKWKIFEDSDAYHGQNEETMPLRQVTVCRRYCLDKGYGGFAVKGSVVHFRKQKSEECAELLAYRKGVVFYLPNTGIVQISMWRMVLRRLVLNPTFEKCMLAITIINVAALAIDYEGIDERQVTAVEIINTVCTALFFLELMMKIFGLGLRLTFKDPYNRVDAVLVAIGVPQMIIFWAANGHSSGAAFSVFRLLRVARILRLGRRWNLLRKTLQIVGGSISSVVYLSLLVVLVLFIYAVLGMHLFGLEKSYSDTRLNFSTLLWSLLTVFCVITGENWSTVMLDTMANVGWPASLYFISLFVIGKYILLNLFIAIIIDNFQKEKEAALVSLSRAEQARLFSNENQPDTDDESQTASPQSNYSESRKLAFNSTREARKRSICELHFKDEQERKNESERVIKQRRIEPKSFGTTTCKCFKADGAMRIWLTPIVTSQVFDVVMMLIIAMNLIFLAVDNTSTRKNSSLSYSFDIAEYIVTTLFVLEMCAKIIVFGLWKTPYAYLKDMWNVIDGFVVLFSVLGLFIPFFRLFRAARVFRLAIRSENVKVVLYAAVGALPTVLNSLVICGFVFVLFGILGVQLFKGIMVECNDTSIYYKENCTGEFVDESGFTQNRTWRTLDTNYNNIFESMLTLFKVGLEEEWENIMFATVDATGRDTGPDKDHNEWAILFFVLFTVIAGFLCLNLIISVLISSFSSYHEARFVQFINMEDNSGYSGWKTDIQKFDIVTHQFLTQEQKRWVRSQQLLVSDITYIPLPESTIRRHVYTLVESTQFEWAIAIVIVMNLLLLCTQHANESQKYQEAFYVLNIIFVSIYTLECLLKMTGYGVVGYFRDPWNRFDFIVLAISITGIVIDTSLTMFRVLRMLRVLRLFHMSKGLNKMFAALLYALPPLFNIGLLILCVFFVFGVIGVDLFGRLDIDLNPYLNRYLNFRNLAEGCILLFQISTGEVWLQVMRGLTVEPPYCTNTCEPNDEFGDCRCGTQWAIMYLVLFMIIVSFLMVNLFVAAVLEAFQDAEDVLSNDELVQAFKNFRRSWLAETFTNAHDNNLMHVATFIKLLQETPHPLGIDSSCRDATLLKLLKNLNIPVDANMMVQYTDCVHALARQVYAINLDQAFELSHLSTVRLSEDAFTVAHFWCVSKILNTWHRHLRNRKEKEEAGHTNLNNNVSHEGDAVFTPFTSIAVHVPEGKEISGDHLGHTFLQIEGNDDVPSLASTGNNKRRKSVVPWDKLEASASNMRVPTRSGSKLGRE